MNRRVVVVAACLLTLAACSKCGGGQKPVVTGPAETPVERVLPKGAVAMVVGASTKQVGEKLKLLEALKIAGFAAQLQGFGDGKAFADALVGQFGIDVRSPEALEKAGIDPVRRFGAALLLSTDLVLALPVKDEKRLVDTLAGLAKTRMGAPLPSELKSGAVTVKTFVPADGSAARLGVVFVQGFAIIAAEQGVQKLAALATLGEGDSFATDALLKEALERSAKGYDLYVFAPNGSPALAKAPLTSALATVTLAPSGLTIALDGAWKGDAAQLALFQKKESTDTTKFLPSDAVLVGRTQGDPAAAGAFINDALGPFIARAFADGQFDFKTQVLDNVKPGASFSLSLAPKPPMDKGMPAFDIRKTNPFSYAHLSGVALVKTPDSVVPTLEKVATVSPRFGAQMQKKDREGKTVFITSWSQGEGVHFGVTGDRVVFGSPIQRVDALLANDGSKAAPVSLPDDSLALAIDLRKLAAAVKELPDSAWGLGGFAMKATTVRWLEATDDLTALSIGFNAKDKLLQGKVVLSLSGVGAKVP